MQYEVSFSVDVLSYPKYGVGVALSLFSHPEFNGLQAFALAGGKKKESSAYEVSLLLS